MEILITNDDGYQAKGIQTLIRLMSQLGHVTVVAPDSARSGQSNAITTTQPLRLTLVKDTPQVRMFVTNGSPTDCVKLALNLLYNDTKPDIIVSGINHGSNAAINVIYSGTMGAVFEGCENDIISIGYSIYDYDSDTDFSFFEPYILKLTKHFLENGLPKGTCLNINAPKGKIKGVRWARQCRGHWGKEFDERTDPHGRTYYWMTGEFINHEPHSQDTDEWALANGYISIVPTKIDMTDYESLNQQLNNESL